VGVCDAIVNFEHVAIPQRREAEIAERYNGINQLINIPTLSGISERRFLEE
jgi:hypothetical protein